MSETKTNLGLSEAFRLIEMAITVDITETQRQTLYGKIADLNSLAAKHNKQKSCQG